MEKTYFCPSCGNSLLKITTIEDGEDIDKFICDICDLTYFEEDLNPSKKKNKKISR